MIPIPGSSICYKKICRCSKLLLGQKAEIKHRFEEAGISPFFEVICNSPFHLVKPKTSPEHLIHPNPSFCCYLFIDKPTWYLLRHFWGAGQFIEFGLLHISVLTYYICSFWICLMVTAAITHQLLMIHSPKFNAPIIMSSPNDCSFKPILFLDEILMFISKTWPFGHKICQWIPHLNCLNHASKSQKKNIPSGYD